MLEPRRQAIRGLAALSLLLTPLSVVAAPDHLVCRRAREATPKATYSADVVSAAYAGTGCVIKAPAKIFCEEATTANVNPPPPFPQFHGRGNAGRFLCYALKCPKDVDTITMTDPLGTHTTSVSTPKLLCAPEIATGFSACPGPGADCTVAPSGMPSMRIPPRPRTSASTRRCVTRPTCSAAPMPAALPGMRASSTR